MDNVKRAYEAFFSTPNGKVILEDLAEKYDRYTTEDGDTIKTYGNSARRDVYMYIKLMSEGQDE